MEEGGTPRTGETTKEREERYLIQAIPTKSKKGGVLPGKHLYWGEAPVLQKHTEQRVKVQGNHELGVSLGEKGSILHWMSTGEILYGRRGGVAAN